jgi:hypothetical protein
MRMAVHGAKARLAGITIEGSGPHSAPNETPYSQDPSPISARNHRRRPIRGGDGEIQIVGQDRPFPNFVRRLSVLSKCLSSEDIARAKTFT